MPIFASSKAAAVPPPPPAVARANVGALPKPPIDPNAAVPLTTAQVLEREKTKNKIAQLEKQLASLKASLELDEPASL
jgi:hypothetical protein